MPYCWSPGKEYGSVFYQKPRLPTIGFKVAGGVAGSEYSLDCVAVAMRLLVPLSQLEGASVAGLAATHRSRPRQTLPGLGSASCHYRG